MASAPSSDFSFFQQWYPIAPIEDLVSKDSQSKDPIAITLLGQTFVIWRRPTDSAFVVFKNECPHRLAPLSEGRVDEKTGNLVCGYHGWQFNSEGQCQTIPQLEKPEFLDQKRQHFCATTLPCQVVNGLLWLWPDADSTTLAAQTPLPLSPQQAPRPVWCSMVQDLACDWQTLVENLADPSHFAALQPDQTLSLTILSSTPHKIEAESQGQFRSNITFEPPCRLEYAVDGGDGQGEGLVAYCLPISAGRSRLVVQFTPNFFTPNFFSNPSTRHLDSSKINQAPKRWLPRWLQHLVTRNRILDGGVILLQQQEKALQQTSKSWKAAYRMPISADRLVIEVRSWFDCYGKATYPWQELPPPSISVEEARDRYHQHTQICGSCRPALRWTQRSQVGLVTLFATTVAVSSLLPDASRTTVGLPLVILGLASLAGAAGLKFWLEPQFYAVDAGQAQLGQLLDWVQEFVQENEEIEKLVAATQPQIQQWMNRAQALQSQIQNKIQEKRTALTQAYKAEYQPFVEEKVSAVTTKTRSLLQEELPELIEEYRPVVQAKVVEIKTKARPLFQEKVLALIAEYRPQIQAQASAIATKAQSLVQGWMEEDSKVSEDNSGKQETKNSST